MLRLLDLQDQRIVAIASGEQGDPGSRPDAPDADHLACHADVPVAVEEPLALVGQGGPIPPKRVTDRRVPAPDLVPGQQLFGGHDEWRIVPELARAMANDRQAAEREGVVLRARLGQVALDVADVPGVRLDRHQLEQLTRVEAQVPDREIAHRSEVAHRLSVRTHAVEDDRVPVPPVEAAIPRRDFEARRQSLHIPSNGPGSVSSKSFTPKMWARSGVPKAPKFERCASPHSWTASPVRGSGARSAAMIAAAPR